MRGEHRPPDERRICPLCSHQRSTPANRLEKVLCVWVHQDGSETTYCHHCSASDVNHHSETLKPKHRKSIDNQKVAEFLWTNALSPIGSVVETYLREARSIVCSIPATIRYLPARGNYPHAMIAAFGLAQETEPKTLIAPDRVHSIHMTRLSGDGRRRLEKRMLGRVSGKPIVLAPPNDSLGLVITEGIEDALSVHAATGLGAWAAGSASHLPRLAPVVPDYIDHVLVIADADEVGQKHAFALAETLLTMKFDVTVKTLDGGYANG